MHLKIFGNHNLLNLQASYHVCKILGVSDNSFADAIRSFRGAAKRLELFAENKEYNIYRDFAHAPSKVMASINAVKQQFPGRKLVAILELHTFSSLNEKFMEEYAGAMDNADEAIVFYSKHALELKRMPPLDSKIIADGFKKTGLRVVSSKEELERQLTETSTRSTNFLFMSSGNYDGMDILKVVSGK